MKKIINRMAQRVLTSQGWGLLPPGQYQSDMDKDFLTLWEQVRPHTLTSPERGYALYDGIRYLEKGGIPGDIVECGVYKGGSSLLAALTLLKEGQTERGLWLYDTFEGMTEPTKEDRIAFTGQAVADRFQENWWAAGEAQVRGLMNSSGYPKEKMHFIAGAVEETLLKEIPSQIALLRLDTDWYQSTKAELEILYPRLVPGGLLIIDDYGHFTGARQAVDEYFGQKAFLARVDYTGRVLVKGSHVAIVKEQV